MTSDPAPQVNLGQRFQHGFNTEMANLIRAKDSVDIGNRHHNLRCIYNIAVFSYLFLMDLCFLH